MIVPVHLKIGLINYPFFGEQICFAEKIDGQMAAFNFLKDEIGLVSSKTRYHKKIIDYPFLDTAVGKVFAIFKGEILVELINPPF